MQEKNLVERVGALPASLHAVAALCVSAMILLGGFAAMHSTDKAAIADEKLIHGAQLSAVMGTTKVDSESLAITNFQQVGDQSGAMLSFQNSFMAADFNALEYHLRGHHPELRATFLWRTAAAPDKINGAVLHSARGKSSVISLVTQPNWTGEIIEIALSFVGEPRSEQLVVDKLVLLPGGGLQTLTSAWSEWFAFRGWKLSSINHLYGTIDPMALSPVIAIAAWAGLSTLLLFAFGQIERKQYLLSYSAAILIPWITLDLLWQSQLSAQLAETRYQFSDKSTHEKHLADIDAGIYSYAKRLKEEVLPASPTRIFILKNASGHDFERLKTQYYLLPHNAYNFGNSWRNNNLESLRPGDYVLVLGEVPGFPPGAGLGKLKWNTQGLQAVLEDVDAFGRLYRLSAARADQLDSGTARGMPGD